MNLLDTFNRMDVASIEALMNERKEENLNLEFKTVNSTDFSNRDDRKNLAITISAFSNSSGGLIVWGVLAAKNPDGIDCAAERKEITSLRIFISQLTRYASEAVHPRPDGILHRAIETSADRGFAITYVPESNMTPHMAKLGENRYYKRSGDSNYMMEHFDLEDMFGRRRKPLLRLNVECKMTDDTTQVEELTFVAFNEGRAVAKHAGMVVEIPEGATLVQTRGLTNISHLNEGKFVLSYYDNVGVIHPNKFGSHLGVVRLTRARPLEPLVMKISLYCENMQSIVFEHVLQPVVRRPMEAVPVPESGPAPGQ